MKAFLDDIIAYIKDAFLNDKDIVKKVSVGDAYDENATLKPPYIFIQEINDNEAYSSFDGEDISYVPMQISTFCSQMKIGEETQSAQSASLIFVDKIKSLFSIPNIVKWNKNIKLVRRVGGTIAMPVQKGTTTYFSNIRYDFYVTANYQKIS